MGNWLSVAETARRYGVTPRRVRSTGEVAMVRATLLKARWICSQENTMIIEQQY